MKIQEEPVDQVKEALVAFFGRQEGGYQEVARTIGVNAQQLYYIISGRNDPTLKTVMRILRFYPNEVKLREALSLPALEEVDNAEGSERDAAHTPAVDVSVIVSVKDQIIEKQNQLIEKLSARVEVLELRNETQAEHIVRLAERDFPGSDSHTTAEQQFNHAMSQYKDAGAAVVHRIGFDYMPKKAVEPTAQIGVMYELGIVEDGDHFAVPPRKQAEAFA